MASDEAGGPTELPRLGTLQVGIVVSDLEATTRFYRDGLGLPVVADNPTPIGVMRFFSCGGDGTVKLLQPAEAPAGSNPPGGILGGSTGLRWFTVRVTGIEDVVLRCEATGGRVVRPVEEWRPGAKIAIVEDPEGSCWVEVAEQAKDDGAKRA
jgi:catechol 2,3-dioxygenase-like lactoylglutathione lyase family enzyme